MLTVVKPIAAFGWSGVGLFLVLSGFSIHFRWAASDMPHHEFASARFFQRRFFRLYPTYIAAVALALFIYVVLGVHVSLRSPWQFAHGNDPAWVTVATQALVLPGNVLPLAIVGVAWSLALEGQLYVMYAFLARRIRTIGVVRLVLIAFVIAISFRVASEFLTSSMPMGQFFPGNKATVLSRILYAQLPSRAFEWLLGVLAAEAYFGRVQLPSWTRSPRAAAGVIFAAGVAFRFPVGATSLNGHFFRVSDVLLDPLVGAGYFLLLQAAIHRESMLVRRLPIRILAFVGGFSYSLYLTHVEVSQLTNKLIGDVGVGGSVQTLCMWSLVIAGAWAFSRAIERPFITGAGDRWVLSQARRLRGGSRVLAGESSTA